MTPYHVHLTQRVPSDPYWRVNCTAYCGAMLITDSGVRISGESVRRRSDEPVPDRGSPGLNIQQIVNVGRGLHVPIIDCTGRSWSEVKNLVLGDRRALVQIDYASLGDWRCQVGGDFGHAIVIAWWGRTTVEVSDPLCRTARVYPEHVIRHAAQVFAEQTGVPGIRFAVTRRLSR